MRMSQAKPSQAHACIPYDLFQVTAPVNKQNRDEKSPCHTLAKDNCAHAAVVRGDLCRAFKPGQSEAAGATFVTDEFTATVQSQNNGSTAVPAIQKAMQVRRLCPSECEALQGFPPGYTDVPYRKKPAADGPRYRALGNSMAVPCMWWLGLRIHKATS